MSKLLENKIKKRTAKVAVIGLGYVGLPLAVNFAKAGFKVFGLDTDQDRVNKVNRRENYILDVDNHDLTRVVGQGNFQASTEFHLLKEADAIIICVPTPLKRKYTPDISYILSAVRSIHRFFKKDTLIVLESTTYPGTTEELIKPELEKGGFKLDQDFYLSFSPERIDPGNKKYAVTKIPKIVGGLSLRSGFLTELLYETIIAKVHLVSSTKTAEMTKLLENSFRIVNIGWINEIAMMCHQMGIDVWEVIDAAKTKPFGFMPFYPGLGVGGHCIPDDPLYLYWKAKHQGFSSKFIKLSADINSHMPTYAVHRLKEILSVKNLKGKKILIVGVTYKKDVKDLRKSPSLKLMEILEAQGVKVDYHDPIISFLKISSFDKKSVGLNSKNLSSYDSVVIATDHSDVDYDLILKKARTIFDIKNVYAKVKNKKITKL